MKQEIVIMKDGQPRNDTIQAILRDSDNPKKEIGLGLLMVPTIFAVIIGGAWFTSLAGKDPIAGIVLTIMFCAAFWHVLNWFDRQ